MAWTAPRTWVTSELVTASLMNTHVRDDLLETTPAKVTTKGDIAVATGANALARVAVGTNGAVPWANSAETTGVGWLNGPGVLHQVNTAVQIVNDASEITILSKSIAAGLLGTSNAICFEIYGRRYNNSGAGRTATIKLKYGATTIATLPTLGVNVSVNVYVVHIWGYLKAAGATDAQRGQISNEGYGMDSYGLDGSAAEDSTGALTLAITWQFSIANASLEFNMECGYTEVRKEVA